MNTGAVCGDTGMAHGTVGGGEGGQGSAPGKHLLCAHGVLGVKEPSVTERSTC